MKNRTDRVCGRSMSNRVIRACWPPLGLLFGDSAAASAGFDGG